MTPNITDITFPARTALNAGCEGVAAINTIQSVMGVNLKTLTLGGGLQHAWGLFQRGCQAHCPCQGEMLCQVYSLHSCLCFASKLPPWCRFFLGATVQLSYRFAQCFV